MVCYYCDGEAWYTCEICGEPICIAHVVESERSIWCSECEDRSISNRIAAEVASERSGGVTGVDLTVVVICRDCNGQGFTRTGARISGHYEVLEQNCATCDGAGKYSQRIFLDLGALEDLRAALLQFGSMA